jgi:hypothetical protein
MQQYAIQELRRLLMATKTLDDSEKTKDYFFNWIQEHNNTAFKVEYKGKQMGEALKEALTFAFKRPIATRGMRIYEVKNLHFTHGMCFFEAHGTGTFFYFSDLDRGMLIRGDGKDYWFAVFKLTRLAGFSFSLAGLEN